MLTSKSYLYKTEWLDLVFDKRNKEYGAYDLRRHYADNLVKAMGITFFCVFVLTASYSFLHKSHPALPAIPEIPPSRIIPVSIIPLVEHPRVIKTVAPPAQHTIKYGPMVAQPEPVSQKPVTIDELKESKIGAVTNTGKDDGSIIIPDINPSAGGGGTAPKIDNTPVDASILEVLPEPYGGSAAWLKFLQKNIRYPGQAIDENIQGKVWISFIVERDGHLSNIVVDRGPGYGLNDEALRVLKLAPAWKPGIQNGQPVRVRYNIPINFQLSE